MQFHKISIPPPQKGFFLRPPSLCKLLSFIHFFNLALQSPPSPGNSNPFCRRGGGGDIFWNCTFPGGSGAGGGGGVGSCGLGVLWSTHSCIGILCYKLMLVAFCKLLVLAIAHSSSPLLELDFPMFITHDQSYRDVPNLPSLAPGSSCFSAHS